MMRRYFLGLLAVILPVALTQTLPAQDEVQDRAADEAADGRSGLFDRLDANGDSQITAGEVPKQRKRLFDRLLRGHDKNDDGKLSREEFAEGTKSRRPERSLEEKQAATIPGSDALQKRLDEMDSNGDGKIEADEVPQSSQGAFERMLDVADGNKDGTLDRREINRASPRLARMAAQRDRRRARGPEGADRPEGAERRQRPEGRRPGQRRPEDAGRRGPQGADRPEGADRREGSEGRRPGQRRPDDANRRGPEGAGRRGPGGPPPRGMPLMRVLDSNHDGALSEDEIAAASYALAELDKNDDGKISRNELMPDRRQAQRPPGKRPGRQAGEGQRPPRQAGEGQRPPRQARQGQDRDRPPRDAPQQGRPKGRSQRGGQGQRPERDFDPERFVRRIMALDEDGDGKISKQEAPEGFKRRFDNLDADGDGLLTRDELDAGAGKRARRARGGERD